MGDNEVRAEPVGPSPNGLLPGAGPVMRAVDTERWLIAEERTAELISCIQPNQLSEERRNAVAEYVQRLIMKCFPCQVCTFGSVPLKTYLPDGDIDLTVFSHDHNLKDTWANQVRDILENEEKNENAEFNVKEVQYIQAEVKIIKCLVENIVVDISFNQVGGLCTLCFLDEVDSLIKQNHLFKRSIILIKAWCYYESRILGAHHGLISTYALETLVLYIFHVFNNSFHGPLEVLYRFLEFFSNFDWDNFCVSLWGPVPISSLPDGIAEPPRKDSGELLLSKLFLDACSSVYAVFPGGQENNGHPFVSKHFNVIDPLRVNNNLGRSVSKGNFFRIRSALAFGAKKLARLLDFPKENLTFEVNQFFLNTWKRHGSGNRPDVPGDVVCQTEISNSDAFDESGNLYSNMIGNNQNEISSFLEENKEVSDRGVSHQHGKVASRMTSPRELSAVSHMQSLKSQNMNGLWAADPYGRDSTSAQVLQNHEVKRDLKSDHLVSDSQARFLFTRTRSSPELTDAYGDVSLQATHHREAKTANAHTTSARLDNSNGKKNLESESVLGHVSCNAEDISYVHGTPQPSGDASSDCNNGPNSYHEDLHFDGLTEEFSSAQVMHNEEQDLVSMMTSASIQSFNEQLHGSFNINSAQLPFSIPPSFITSMAHAQRNLPGFVPANTPLIDPSFANVQFPHEVKSEELLDSDTWQEQNVGSSSIHDAENGNIDIIQSEEKPSSMSGLKYVPPPRMSNYSGSSRGQQKHTREKRGAAKQISDTSLPIQDDRNSDGYSEERSVSSRFSSTAHSNSLRSRTSSESSWDGSSAKNPKSVKEKRGKRSSSTNLSAGKGKTMSENLPKQAQQDDQEWGSLSNPPIPALQVPRHHLSSFEVAQTSGSESVNPVAPILTNSSSGQRIHDGLGLVAFYPTGPPIPFLTMLPIYNVSPETGASEQSSGHFEGDESAENNESGKDFSSEGYDHSDDLNTSSSFRGTTSAEASENKKSDILNSDFLCHWQNLQFGRFCQNPRNHGPSLYPSPVMVPPAYLQGRFPYENPGRPFATNTNLISQLMTSFGQRLFPVAHVQSIPNRPANPYQPYIDDLPRYRSGTGTYLPNPNQKIPARERHSSNTRRGGYNHDRNENYGDREGNWNANPKARASVRSHARSQPDKLKSRADRSASNDNRGDRSWNSYRHESVTSYQSPEGPLTTNSGQIGPQNMAYSMYPLVPMNLNGASNGPSGMMLYPYGQNASFGPQGEQLEFGSLGPVGLPVIEEQLQLNDGTRARAFEDHRHHRSSDHCSSPDRPSSAHNQRRIQ